MVPVPSAAGDLPFAFNIAMGVKPDKTALREELDRIVERKHAEITNILKAFGVPLVSGKGVAK
jgi:hypothetical protein